MHPLDFLAQLRFKQVGPGDVFMGMDLQRQAENTLLPESCQKYYDLVPQLQYLNRMSSFANMALMGVLLDAVPRQIPYEEKQVLKPCYLNIGVWHGFSLFSAFLMAPDLPCIGVDNFSENFSHESAVIDAKQSFYQHYKDFRQQPEHTIYEMDYRDYFKQHDRAIGVYFYDGRHSYEDQLLGLQLADPYLIPFAYVLVDDTNDAPARQATLDFVAQNPRYRILADLRTATLKHPTFWNGIMLLQKCPPLSI